MNRLVQPRKFLLNAYAPTASDLGRPVAKAMQAVVRTIEKFGDGNFELDGLLQFQPVLLRWASDPSLGFGRQPFKVFQRFNKNSDFLPLQSGAKNVSGFEAFNWQLPGFAREMYELRLTASTKDSFLRIMAVGKEGKLIEGQEIFLSPNTSRRLCFRAPGISAIHVFGTGKISELRGIDQQTYANFKDWFQLETVGFPFKTSEIGNPVYDPQIQGYSFNPLEGPDAARLRLEIAKILHFPIPDIPFPPRPVDWPPPKPSAYTGWLRSDPLSIIRECLEKTDDRDENNLQADYLSSRRIAGIQQADFPSSSPGTDTDIQILVVGAAMLGLVSDGFLATGLGYGTLAFGFNFANDPNCLMPEGGLNLDTDFMVTNEFVLDPTAEAPAVEIAALAQLRPPPKLALNFNAAKLFENRPPDRDLPASESVKLSWDFPEFFQSYAIAVNRNAQPFKILNSPRIIGGSFNPFLPAVSFEPDGTVIEPGRATFTDPTSFVPVAGSVHADYSIIGLDVFGRWSLWQRTPYNVTAPPVQKPAIHRVEIILDNENGPLISAKMEIDFSWEWLDRSPLKIEFMGQFFPADSSNAPATIPGIFVLSNQGIPGFHPKVSVLFDPTSEEPLLQAPHSGTLRPLTPTSPPASSLESDLRRYRLVLEGVTCDFSAVEELAFALFARAAERVRPLAFSDLVGPAVARTIDPTPPETPEIVAELNWTALPDATGIARGLLTWPAVSGAKGYVIWEATEQAVRVAIDPSLEDPSSESTLVERATELKTSILGADARSMQAFAKLNKDLVRENRLEVELPGKSDTIFAFRVSAVNGQNKDSSRSEPVFFAVPHRNEPGQPKLILRQAKEPAPGIWVIALPGAGPETVGYRIHRVGNVFLQKDIGTMGPPKVLENNANWQPLPDLFSDPAASKLLSLLNSLEPFELEQGKAFLDTPSTRWTPYFYRIVAIGKEDLPEGELAGESLPSAAKSIFLTPPDAPVLRNLEVLAGSTQVVGAIPLPLPLEMVSDSLANKVFVLSLNKKIIALDAATESILSQINVPGRPRAIAINEQSKRLCVTTHNTRRVLVINTKTNRRLATIKLHRRPFDVAVDSLLNKIYVTQFGKRIAVIDGSANRLVNQIKIGGNSRGIAVNEERSRVYVANHQLKSLIGINSRTDSIESTTTLPFKPHGIRVNPVSQKVYISERSGKGLLIVREDTLSIQKRLKLNGKIRDLEIDAERNKVFATLSTGRLAVINGNSDELEEEINFPGPAFGVTISSALKKIFVSQFPQNRIRVLKQENSNGVLRFETNLPVKANGLGPASIRLLTLTFDPATGSAVRESPFLQVNADEVEEGALLAPLSDPTPAQLDAMPEINRSAAGSDGFAVYSVRVEKAVLAGKRIIVLVIDPLNRTKEEQFNEIF